MKNTKVGLKTIRIIKFYLYSWSFSCAQDISYHIEVFDSSDKSTLCNLSPRLKDFGQSNIDTFQFMPRPSLSSCHLVMHYKHISYIFKILFILPPTFTFLLFLLVFLSYFITSSLHSFHFKSHLKLCALFCFSPKTHAYRRERFFACTGDAIFFKNGQRHILTKQKSVLSGQIQLNEYSGDLNLRMKFPFKWPLK